MDQLPLELISLITTKYLDDHIDKLAFIISSKAIWLAFIQCASSIDKYRLARQFDISDFNEAVHEDDLDLDHPGLKELTRLYNSLQSLVSNNEQPLTKIRCHYSLDRRRGYFQESEFRSKSSINNLDWIRNTITHSTFALAYDENRFVLMHSLNGRQSCIMTIWNSESELVSSNTYPFEVMGQDLLLHSNYLFVQPLMKAKNIQNKAKKYENVILLVLDPLNGGIEKAKFQWETPRMPPDVYKESGEARLYASAEGQRVLQVFPSWPWTLFLYQWTTTAPDKLNLVKMWPLEWIKAPTIGQLFCSDQQGTHLVLAFFASKNENIHTTKVVTLDFDAGNLQDVPMLDKYEVDLSQPVSEIQLFLTATTDYKINKQGKIFHRRSHFNEQNNDFQPLVIILYPDGNLKTNQNTNQDNSNFSQRSGRHCPPFDVLPNFWQFNELFVKDNRIFVMHQIPQIGRIVYATNLNLEHLWNFKLDQQGIPWHPKQRLYLYASHGLVWLSDAKGCVLLNQESGLVKGQLKYPHYQRILPELDSLTEDTSPYAQTGYSIWSIRMFNSRSLTVVHDIERCSPTIVDILKF